MTIGLASISLLIVTAFLADFTQKSNIYSN